MREAVLSAFFVRKEELMTLDLERVKAKFYLYSGEDSSGEETRKALCGQLCEECAAAVGKLPLKAEAGENGGPLESWAAAEAFYQLALRDRAAAPEIISADGVRVDAQARAENARALAEEKYRAARRLLREEGFWFEHI